MARNFIKTVLKGKVRPIGTLVLLIVLLSQSTLPFTRTKTDPVNRRYDPINMAKSPDGQIVGIIVLLIVLFFKNTMLFTGSQTDVVRRRYSSGCKGFQKNAWIGVLPWS